MTEEASAASLHLQGGALCLDFANTVGDHNSDHPHDHLTGYAELVAWSRHAGVLTARAADQLLQQATQQPRQAHKVVDQAVELREAIYRIFSSIASKQSPRKTDIAILNRALSTALAHSKIVSVHDGFTLDWNCDEPEFDQMLWPIARSAADLLTSEELIYVRECDSETCGWLFVDRTKNHSRRWCDMKDCGNRAKVRKYYQRLKAVA